MQERREDDADEDDENKNSLEVGEGKIIMNEWLNWVFIEMRLFEHFDNCNCVFSSKNVLDGAFKLPSVTSISDHLTHREQVWGKVLL